MELAESYAQVVTEVDEETKKKLKNARNNFEYAEEDMIDYYIFQIKANQSKLDYLIKIAKNNEKNKKNNIYCTKNTIDREKRGSEGD